MELQYISDNEGNHTAVIIPIAEWNNITAKHQDLKELAEAKPTEITKEEIEHYSSVNIQPKKKSDQKKPSDFKGTLSKEEGQKFHTYLKEVRNEWERNF